MRNTTLQEKMRLVKEAPFSMPREVSCQKTFLPEGVCAYVFRHNRLGELGRVLLLPSQGQTQFTCEVAGDPNDPMTLKRKDILEPITRNIAEAMARICGERQGTLQPYSLREKQHLIKSEVMPCEQCRAPTAMLIYAPDAFTAGRLEDYARLMYENIKTLNVPTWIVGAEKEIVIQGDYVGEAWVLKVWPTRDEAKIILSTTINALLDVLMQTHCQSITKNRKNTKNSG